MKKLDNAFLWLLDWIVLTLWNQFSIKRIVIMRVFVTIWLGGALAGNTRLFEKGTMAGALMFAMIFMIILIGAILLQGMEELLNRFSSVEMQNSRALHQRERAGWFRFLSLGLIVLWSLPTLMAPDLYDIFTTISQVAWFFWIHLSAAFIPTQPPKRWKLKLKAPKLSLDWARPVPQGSTS